MCVQVVSVSPSSLQLPGLSARMASVYNVRRSEEMWNLIGVVSPGLVCAVGDREGGWYRGVVVECVKDRLVMVQYVDFGNFELTPVYNLRRLLPEYIEELPVLAIPVSLPVVFSNTDEKDFVFPELIKNILYQEMKLKVISMSPNGEVLVSLRTREEDARVEKFIRILKDECSYS